MHQKGLNGSKRTVFAILHIYVPSCLIERHKGFHVPGMKSPFQFYTTSTHDAAQRTFQRDKVPRGLKPSNTSHFIDLKL